MWHFVVKALFHQPAPVGLSQRSGPPNGKNKGQPKQNLFLIYLDAMSVVNSKRADKSLPQQQAQPQHLSGTDQQQQQQQLEQQLQLQQQVSAAAPNMPDFTLKDLQFILTFTGEGRILLCLQYLQLQHGWVDQPTSSGAVLSCLLWISTPVALQQAMHQDLPCVPGLTPAGLLCCRGVRGRSAAAVGGCALPHHIRQ